MADDNMDISSLIGICQRIMRIERTLTAVYDALPSFIKGNLMNEDAGDGKTIDYNIEAMRKDNGI